MPHGSVGFPSFFAGKEGLYFHKSHFVTGVNGRKNVKKLLILVALGVPAIWAQATTTTYTLPPAVCVNIQNCIIYGPAESFSLWTTPHWSIFSIYSWVNGFSTVDTFNCPTETYTTGPGNPQGISLMVTCSGNDANGAPFTMSYAVTACSYYSRGGGKGGGGAGTRWQITGGSVTITK